MPQPTEAETSSPKHKLYGLDLLPAIAFCSYILNGQTASEFSNK